MKTITVNGTKLTVDLESLARVIAINYADWKASIGKAHKIVEMLPKIIKIEKELF